MPDLDAAPIGAGCVNHCVMLVLVLVLVSIGSVLLEAGGFVDGGGGGGGDGGLLAAAAAFLKTDRAGLGGFLPVIS